MSVLDEVRPEWDALVEAVNDIVEENNELRALCRDMYLIVGVLDARGARIALADKTTDWCTIEQRYEALFDGAGSVWAPESRVCERGTCHMEYNAEYSNDELYPTIAYECSVCGNITLEGKPNFCPQCGNRVRE